MVLPDPTKPIKFAMYRSQHNPYAPPTGSTIGLLNTSSKVANLSGNSTAVLYAHSPFKDGANYGPHRLLKSSS
jgi:hypothetical protein